MPLEVYTALLTACLHFRQNGECCSGACKYLQIMHGANAACCMTPKVVAADAAGCTPLAQNLFLGDQQNFYRHILLPLLVLNVVGLLEFL